MQSMRTLDGNSNLTDAVVRQLVRPDESGIVNDSCNDSKEYVKTGGCSYLLRFKFRLRDTTT